MTETKSPELLNLQIWLAVFVWKASKVWVYTIGIEITHYTNSPDTILSTFWKSSTGNLNPAVSVGLMVGGQLPFVSALLYIAVQVWHGILIYDAVKYRSSQKVAYRILDIRYLGHFWPSRLSWSDWTTSGIPHVCQLLFRPVKVHQKVRK